MTTNIDRFTFSTIAHAVRYALLAMAAAPLVATAADEDADVASLTQPTSSIEVGAENVSSKSAKFGEYNGLNKSGAAFIGNIDLRGGDAYQSFQGGMGTTRWQVRGTDLGTTSREIGGTVSSQGRWDLGVSYDQLRHNITDSYQTPFQGSLGGNSLTLPASFGVIDATDDGPVGSGTQGLTAGQIAAFHAVDVYTERKNTSFNAGYRLDRQWNFEFAFNHLDQSGAKLISVSMSPDALGNGAGEKTATLMNPTNYRTDTFELAANWIGERAHLRASYYASLFKDGYHSLSWSNPYIDSGGATPTGTITGNFPLNVFATTPDNSVHQLNLSGGYEFTSATRLVGGLSYSRNTQNISFIDDPLLTSALPSGSLNGLVITKHADLKLTNQTSKDLLLSAGVKYNERDNQTPSNVFDSFASIAGDPWGPVANAPVSNKKLQVELDGSYRIDKKQTLRLSYAYDDVKRWCNNALANNFQSSDVLTNVPNYYTTTACVQSPQSRENKLAANYRLKAGQGVNFTAGYSYAKRRADFNTSYYNPMQTSAEGLQNFGFVPYFDASRRDQIVKSGLNWQANDRFNLGLTGRFIDTKYDSTLGVQKGHGLALNLDAAYNYAAGGVVSAYLSGQRRQRDLLSSADKSPLVAPGNLWSNHLDEDSNTLGITAKHRGLMGGRLDLTGDLSYSLSKTTYSTQLQDPTQCTDINCGDLPVIKNEVLRLKFTGVYHVDKASKVALSGLYQKLKSDDYYYSAYQLGYTDVTVLPTNQLAPNHSVTAAGISYIYSFR